MLVVPRPHRARLHDATEADLASAGRALRTALVQLRRRVGDVAYNLVIHSAPYRTSGVFHWHIHVLPRIHSVGGFEQGTGVPINIMAPEQARELLAV